MQIAITRKVSPSIANCELTHLARVPIDLALAEKQHAAYEQCLATLGCEVHSLPAEPGLPDSVFVEDTAVIFDELAIIARPGAESRRAETASIGAALRPYRDLRFIEAPGTVDGGDVLVVGRSVFVGLSARTNRAAVDQMQSWLAPFGYTVTGVPVSGCLHLKSAITRVGPQTVLLNPDWVPTESFNRLEIIVVDASEPYAANGLLIGSTVLYPMAYSRTRSRLEAQRVRLAFVDVSELAKAEGAVTCCSLILFSESRQSSSRAAI